jgi:hypothetical protein
LRVPFLLLSPTSILTGTLSFFNPFLWEFVTVTYSFLMFDFLVFL